MGRVEFPRARVVKSVDTGDLQEVSPHGETHEVTPVKFGERPGHVFVRANAEPSPWIKGRCREQTAGTYGRKTTVKACSRPRTRQGAAKAEVVRKSPDRKVVPVRVRPRAPDHRALSATSPHSAPFRPVVVPLDTPKVLRYPTGSLARIGELHAANGVGSDR